MTSPLRPFDVHTETACRLTGKPPESITPEERRLGKTINYCAIYANNSANAILTALELTGPNAELRSIRQTDQWE